MTNAELIEKLKQLPPGVDVVIEQKLEECEVCSNLRHEKCTWANKFYWSLEEPYLHEASSEIRLRGY